MAGLLITNGTQFGDSSTATHNFTLTAAQDNGTLKLSRGNAGATTQDIFTVDATGKVAFLVGLQALGNYANDSAAATGGVPVGGLYRNGSVLMIRVA